MNRETELAELSCPDCDQTTEHEITYAGRLLVSVRCTVCGREIHGHADALAEDYRDDLLDRLRSKPRRLGRRLRRNPAGFVTSLPRAIIRQPLKLYSEFRTVQRERNKD